MPSKGGNELSMMANSHLHATFAGKNNEVDSNVHMFYILFRINITNP